MYLQFVVSQCGGAARTQSATNVSSQVATQAGQQAEPDPYRPVCTTPKCEKTKAFVKLHYCGESPFANGPDDGCDIRVAKNRVPSTALTAAYICNCNEIDGTSQCEQRG
jgi:hypothetical protein